MRRFHARRGGPPGFCGWTGCRGHNIALVQRRHQLGGNIEVEHLAVHRSVDDAGRIQPVVAQRADEGLRTPVAEGVQRVGIVVVPPALCGQQHSGAEELGEVVGDVTLAARVLQAAGHPAKDTAALECLSQHHRTRIAGQPIGPALDPKRTIETGRYRL